MALADPVQARAALADLEQVPVALADPEQARKALADREWARRAPVEWRVGLACDRERVPVERQRVPELDQALVRGASAPREPMPIAVMARVTTPQPHWRRKATHFVEVPMAIDPTHLTGMPVMRTPGRPPT